MTCWGAVARRIPFDNIPAAEKLRHVRAAVAGIEGSDAQDDVLCDVAWTLAVRGSPEAVEILRLVRDPAKRSLSLIGLARARGHPGAMAALEEETRKERERRQRAGPSFPNADELHAAMARTRAEQPLLRRARRLRLLRDRLGPAPPGHADEARRLIAEALAAGERIRGFE